MSGTQIIDLALALLNAAAAAYVVVRGRHWLGRASTPLLALGGYFTLRSLSRFSDALLHDGAEHATTDIMLDVLLAITLVLVITTLEPIARGIAAREDAARYRAEEYDRARRHYEQVVRHRLFNPLTVIRGAAVTLRDDRIADEDVRARLLEAIVEASDEIEDVSLVPDRRDELERDLDAIPRVDDERRHTSFPDGPPGPT